MSTTVDVAFVFLPANEMERLPPGQVSCEISAYDQRAEARVVTKERAHSGERQPAQLLFAQEAPTWLRKGLAIRLRRMPD